jgi:hypothetical protein
VYQKFCQPVFEWIYGPPVRIITSTIFFHHPFRIITDASPGRWYDCHSSNIYIYIGCNDCTVGCPKQSPSEPMITLPTEVRDDVSLHHHKGKLGHRELKIAALKPQSLLPQHGTRHLTTAHASMKRPSKTAHMQNS